MLLVHSLIPWSRFISEKPEVTTCSSCNPQAKRVPSLGGTNTLRIPEKNPQENFWTLQGVIEGVRKRHNEVLHDLCTACQMAGALRQSHRGSDEPRCSHGWQENWHTGIVWELQRTWSN